MSVWALLERPSLRTVWATLHERLERNAEARTVRLDELGIDVRTDLQGLLGLPTRPGPEYTLNLVRLDAALARAEPGLTTRMVVEAVVGPIVDRRERRAQAVAAEALLWEQAIARSDPRLHAWLYDLRTSGLLKSLATKSNMSTESMLDRALRCASALPLHGMLLQVLASERGGDPHALDQNRPLAALVLRAAASLVGWPDIARTPTERRALWAEVGVLTEGHSSHVLVHAFRPVGDGPLARHLREQADRGLPRKITLAELQTERIRLPPGTTVFLIENVSVVDEAARRHGRSCAPIVCLEGEPTVAVWELLANLREGSHLVFHCDFDTAGVRIANRVYHRVGAHPWLFDAMHYERGAGARALPTPLEGTVIETPWDRTLAEAMRRLGVAVFEEDVLETLVADLRERPRAVLDDAIPF